jgi:ribosomal protein S18 acetylase RimI-like enzyme
MNLWQELMDLHAGQEPFFKPAKDGKERFGFFVLQRLKEPEWLILLAIKGEVPIGFLMGSIMEYPRVFAESRFGFIQDMVVTAACRGQGVGRELFLASLDWFTAQKVSRVELQVAAVNDEAQAFWQKMGFRDFLHRWAREV